MKNKKCIHLLICCLLMLRFNVSAQELYNQINKADSLYQNAHYKEASMVYDKILSDEINITELSDAQKTELHNNAGLAYYYCKNFEKSVSHFEQIIALNEDTESKNLLVLCYNNMGMVYYSWQKTDKAIEYYQKAIDLFASLEDKSQTTIIYTNIGLLYNSINNQTKAIEYFKQALAIDKTLNHPSDIASDCNNIGIAYKSMEQYELAKEFFKQGIVIYQSLDKNKLYVELLKNVAFTYSAMENKDSALFYVNLLVETNKQFEFADNDSKLLIVIGDIYYNAQLLDSANSYYTRALNQAIARNEQDNICNLWKRLGNTYFSQFDYLKAIEYYTLSLESELKKENLNDAAQSYNAIGDIYMVINKFDNALVNYQKAYKLSQIIKNEAISALSFNNIGKVYTTWGQYDKAIIFFKEALANAEVNKNQNEMAESYHHLGLIYKVWGKYDEAIAYYIKALDINTIQNKTDKIAINITNIGLCYQKKGESNLAFDYFNKAMNYAQQTKNDNIISVCATNMGFYYKSIGDIDKALENFKQALEIDLKIKKQDNIASDYNNIGTIYLFNKDFIKANEFFSKALFIDSTLRKEADIAIDNNNLGASYIGMNQFEKAIYYLSNAISIKEKLRKTAIGDIRREYFESQINTYNDLIFAYLSIQDVSKAFETIELTKAKLLAEQISLNDSNFSIPSIIDIQSKLNEKTAIILYATTNREDLTIMLITKERVLTQKNNKKVFTDKLLKIFDVEIKSYLFDQLSENVRFNPQLLNTEIKSKKHELEPIIQYYRKLLLIANPSKEDNEKTILLSKMLYEFLISPIAPSLNNINTLIIEPEGIISFLPFETLKNNESEYLVLNKDISYTPSLSILNILKNRNYATERKPLLAIGGGIYNKKSYKADMNFSDILLQSDTFNYNISKGTVAKYLNEEQIKYLQKKTSTAILENTSLKDIYYELGYGKWSNLPGSLTEVRVLAKLIADTDTITASDVNESKIKTLSKSGDLMKYKTIHISTHGIGIPEIPELSAIILNPDDTLVEDGYLRMGEISELKLNADFVNLSACETGLGKIYSGEGVVGLTQSFLIAGANGVSASLWQVNDQSTAQFMIDVFSLVKNENLSYMQAINKTKRLYIEGKHSNKWKTPYYWAPFVYYGN